MQNVQKYYETVCPLLPVCTVATAVTALFKYCVAVYT